MAITSVIIEERTKREKAEQSLDLAQAGCAELKTLCNGIMQVMYSVPKLISKLNFDHGNNRGPFMLVPELERELNKLNGDILDAQNPGQALLDRLNASEKEVERLKAVYERAELRWNERSNSLESRAEEERAELYNLALAATPGPWKFDIGSSQVESENKEHCFSPIACRVSNFARNIHHRDFNLKWNPPHFPPDPNSDMQFIAAANPQAIIELIGMIAVLKEELRIMKG